MTNKVGEYQRKAGQVRQIERKLHFVGPERGGIIELLGPSVTGICMGFVKLKEALDGAAFAFNQPGVTDRDKLFIWEGSITVNKNFVELPRPDPDRIVRPGGVVPPTNINLH